MSSNFYIRGIKDACGVPVIGLGLSMFTFGAYLNASNFNLFQSFLSTFLLLHCLVSLLWLKLFYPEEIY